MQAAPPWVDAFESGHNLASLEAVAASLGRLGRGADPRREAQHAEAIESLRPAHVA